MPKPYPGLCADFESIYRTLQTYLQLSPLGCLQTEPALSQRFPTEISKTCLLVQLHTVNLASPFRGIKQAAFGLHRCTSDRAHGLQDPRFLHMYLSFLHSLVDPVNRQWHSQTFLSLSFQNVTYILPELSNQLKSRFTFFLFVSDVVKCFAV